MNFSRGDKAIGVIKKRLKMANISFYKIAKEIGEPESTIHNIFKGQKKYADDKVVELSNKILDYLEKVKSDNQNFEDRIDKESAPAIHNSPEIFENTDTYTKLYELGLNSKLFTPAEKLHLALMYKTITDYKNQLIKQNQTPNGDEKNSDNSESFKASRETFGSEAGVHSRDT